MSRQAKELLKEIASFGEKQFHETGAAAVEVLRVKASTIRKHFRKLKGIAYLVSVISLDRVRIYFFNTTGILLLAENIDPILYSKIRKTSRLIIKYEKPRPPTEEELRIEATEELRTEFSKAIRRVSRMLGQKEPTFPTIFVSRESLNINTQGFGLIISDDGTMVFEEKSLESNYADGLHLRAATLLLFDIKQAQLPYGQCLSNALAYSLLKEPMQTAWLNAWVSNTPDELLSRVLMHYVRHSSTYTENGYHRFITLLQETPPINQLERWIDGLKIIHDSLEVSLGTEDFQTFKHFCSILEKPRKLTDSNYILESIHLAPRVLCDPTPLGLTLSIHEQEFSPSSNGWLTIQYLKGSEKKSITISEDNDNTISSIDYFLNIEDLSPKPAGIVAHGKDFIRWAKNSMQVTTDTIYTFESRIEFSSPDLTLDEKAVLERLIDGNPEVLLNSLIGSPQRVSSLVKKGKVVFLPNFQHLGLMHNLLIIGENESVYSGAREYSLESTILNSENASYAAVCAPVHWASKIKEFAFNEGLQVYPIVKTQSIKQIIRCENTLPSDLELQSWISSFH